MKQHYISLDNGHSFLTAAEAMPGIRERSMWDTVVWYMDDETRVDGRPLPMTGTDEDGDPYYQIDTYQRNGWIRRACIHADGTVEETYAR